MSNVRSATMTIFGRNNSVAVDACQAEVLEIQHHAITIKFYRSNA
ncbi:hypothetical protein SAMN05216302_100369 [Nitrosomonas aestuarii]|uniref:Uncharacterized protein n=1 Tax=Nitrosomonas aestuarii TaxID=52441 RepID=A0A1I3Y9D1_9PROT|nr:hypothetical protein SAMN05216302_100369 [Nitrosomonas aestuarii]